MGIGIISGAISGSLYLQNNKAVLPNDIYNRLVELGIDPNSVSSLNEAKQAIAKAENAQNEKENNDGQNNNEMRQGAETLASKIGLAVNDNDTTEDILSNIEDLLDRMSKIAIQRGDEGLFNLVKEYKIELNILIEENNGGGVSNTVVYSFMDMLANQNKYALGLNKKQVNQM